MGAIRHIHLRRLKKLIETLKKEDAQRRQGPRVNKSVSHLANLLISCVLVCLIATLVQRSTFEDAASSPSSFDRETNDVVAATESTRANAFEAYRKNGKIGDVLTEGQFVARIGYLNKRCLANDAPIYDDERNVNAALQEYNDLARQAPSDAKRAEALHKKYLVIRAMRDRREKDGTLAETGAARAYFENMKATLERIVESIPFSLYGWELLAEHITSSAEPLSDAEASRAQHAYDRLLNLESTDPSRWLDMALFQLGRARLSDARLCFEQCQHLVPKSAEIVEAASAGIVVPKRFDSLRLANGLKRMCEYDVPEDTDNANAVGWACLQSNRHDRARSILRASARTGKGRALVEAHILLSNFERTVEDKEARFRQARNADSQSARAAHVLGTFLGEQGRDVEAFSHLHAAAQLDSRMIDAHFNLGIVAARIGTMLRDSPETRIEPDLNFLQIALTSFNDCLREERQRRKNVDRTVKRTREAKSSLAEISKLARVRDHVRMWGMIPVTWQRTRVTGVMCNQAILLQMSNRLEEAFMKFKSCMSDPMYDTQFAGAQLEVLEAIGSAMQEVSETKDMLVQRSRASKNNSDLDALQECVAVDAVDCRGGKNCDNPFYDIRSYVAESPELLPEIVQAIERAAERRGGWTTDRHAAYPTTDVALEDVPEIIPWFLQLKRNLIAPIVRRDYQVDVVGFHDVFLIKYEAVEGRQDSLAFHRDSSLLSFTMLLNDPSAFDGGGTVFRWLRDSETLEHKAGEITFHCGQLLHGGRKITRGIRYIMAGFVSITSDRLNTAAVVDSKSTRISNTDVPDSFYIDGIFSKFSRAK
eukprot:g2589.t1